MPAMTTAAARAATYANTKLGQVLLGQHIELGLDSADQVGFGVAMQDAFAVENMDIGQGDAGAMISAAAAAAAHTHAQAEQLLLGEQVQPRIDQAQ